MFRTTLAVIGVAGLLGACGGSDPRSYPGVDALAEALRDGGVECSDLVVADAPTGEDAGKSLPKDAGTCGSDDEGLQLFVFADVEARDKWLTLGKMFSENVVTGPNWTVIAQNEDAAERVADALEGET
jgi:hypothetical protein